MAKIFRRESADFTGLRAFFLAWREINPEKLSQLAGRFIELAQAPGEPGVDIVEEMAELLADRAAKRGRSARETISSFLEELAGHMRERFRATGGDPDALERWNEAAREAATRIESLNMAPAAVLEALFYRLRAEAAA